MNLSCLIFIADERRIHKSVTSYQYVFFFFQAEDGIGDSSVTGVQTCALPIFAVDFEDARFLVQGTLYPDIIESGTKDAAKIKSHHNVGGLPDDMQFELVEPLQIGRASCRERV